MSRRIKTLAVSPEVLVLLLRSGTRRIFRDALPDDARPVRASIDGAGRIVLVVESKDFAEVGTLDPVPILPAPCFEVHY
jgi:hypothetical protein